jgi:DNA topoisomerase I
MSKNLVIVESPAKAKTIAGFLGKDFAVESSFGHIRDLVQKDMGVDVKNGFKPVYEVSKDKKEIVKKLKKLCSTAEIVWLASDEDREGEAIAWHLAETLGLDPLVTNRIVFHEITKTAIQKAVSAPRTINMDLVNAQQARRVLDRLVGYELSPVLWKKVRRGLSAGRVQSVSVRLLVEREREIQAFNSESAFRIVAEFNAGKKVFKAELNERFQKSEEAQAFLSKSSSFQYSIEGLEVKPAKRSPAAPFTTSTLQQEASRKLGFPVGTTMQIAQKLYEAGFITYMRTDSVNLSDDALAAARNEIVSSYGAEFAETRKFKTKARGAQEAHEAIRPTYMDKSTVGGDARMKKLYELIWKRTLASQMSDAKLERTTVTIPAPNGLHYTAKGEVIRFEGFLKVYLEDTDDEDAEEQKGMLPALSLNQVLNYDRIEATERYTRPSARYTEASLVKKLEELGIGRPSTYAPTISTIVKREYAVKSDLEGEERAYQQLVLKGSDISSKTLKERTGADKGKLMPTDIGMVVNDFLVEHFNEVLDFHFTAKVEEDFDRIAEGEVDWTEMLDGFYKEFRPNIDKVEENAGYAKGERSLGFDPESGKPIVAKIARYGPVVQLGSAEDEDKPRFASLLKDQRIESITLEEALKLFQLPRVIGELEGKELKAGIGRFGPYVQHGSLYASIKASDGDDPITIGLDRATELILAKRDADAKKKIALFEGDPVIEILNGRWGPYIKVGKENHRIPKGTDVESLDREACEALIAKGPKSKK